MLKQKKKQKIEGGFLQGRGQHLGSKDKNEEGIGSVDDDKTIGM